MSKKFAIAGSGCAGLGAAWALKDVDCEIHLFETDDRLGGHTNTQPFRHGDLEVPVDTGFIVMNTATYPNFIRFLAAVGVDTVPTAMTFAVSRDHGRFEWSGEANGIFAQRRNFFRPRHYRMIFDIVRFNMFALDVLDDPKYADVTIGEYLHTHGYSKAFCDDYLIPMTAAVWSTSPDKASLEFPAQTLIRFLWNHHLLSTLAKRPDWLTIPGGSQKYIDAIQGELGPKLHVHMQSSVRGVSKSPSDADRVILYWEDLRPGLFNSPENEFDSAEFDHVIFACHGDQISDILKSDLLPYLTKGSSVLSQEDKKIFSAFKTTRNKCYLHSDLSLMPTRRETWSSWNYLINSVPKPNQPAGVSLTYNMNILQHIPADKYGNVLVTMNPDRPPEEKLTQDEYDYSHPLYTLDAIRAQQRLERIQGKGGVSFCGAWTNYGFHEDGFSSGLKVAMRLGAKLPFEFVDSTRSRGGKPSLPAVDVIVRFIISIIATLIHVVEIMLRLPGVSWMVEFVSVLGEMALDGLEDVGFLK
jgi:predicted NAD/FAD-binding protein